MEQLIAPLLQTGVAGAILAWFMFRLEPRIRSLEESIDRQVRAMMLDLMAHNQLRSETVRQLQQIVEEIDRKTAR